MIRVEERVAELGAAAYVAFNELTRRRLGAHVATTGTEIVRLTQPIDVSFADGARDPVAAAPRRAVAVSRRMTTVPARLAKICAGLGIEFQRIGGDDGESPDPRLEMMGADIVFAIGRTALEAMAAARAVAVVDETSFGGWVSTASYSALEADGFTGLGLGEIGDRGAPREPGDENLEELLSGYDPELGTEARRLVTRHHAAASCGGARGALHLGRRHPGAVVGDRRRHRRPPRRRTASPWSTERSPRSGRSPDSRGRPASCEPSWTSYAPSSTGDCRSASTWSRGSRAWATGCAGRGPERRHFVASGTRPARCWSPGRSAAEGLHIPVE